MTNEEKARELAEMLIGGDRNIEPIVDTLLQAMQWKDEQWKKRLQDAFIGGWTASLDIENNDTKQKTTISFVKENF